MYSGFFLVIFYEVLWGVLIVGLDFRGFMSFSYGCGFVGCGRCLWTMGGRCEVVDVGTLLCCSL